MIRYREGDLFASGLPAIAHGVNCKGVMGAGIAAQFKACYPQMAESYRRRCARGHMIPGDVLSWQHDGGIVFNLATQDQPGADARPWMITAATGRMIQEARYLYQVTEIGLPWIGCGIGGLCLNDLKSALAPYRDAPVNLTVFELVHPGAPPRCDNGHGSHHWCTQPAAWLQTWECPAGHLVYRRLCGGHDPGLPAEAYPSGPVCGFSGDDGMMCVRPATMIARTRPQR